MNVMFDKPFNNELNKYTFRPNTSLQGQVRTKQEQNKYTISMTANNTNVCPVFIHHTTSESTYLTDPFFGFATFFGASGMTYFYTFLNGGASLSARTGSVEINIQMSNIKASCVRMFANQVNDLSL